MASITFDVIAFLDRYPEFKDTRDAMLTACFNEATCYINNATNSCLNESCLTAVLWSMTAHICRLDEMGRDGNQAGVVTSSSVGSVSVSLQAPPFGGDQWKYWMNLTPYGQKTMALLSSAAVGGLYVGGNPERSAFRRVGGGFGGPLF